MQRRFESRPAVPGDAAAAAGAHPEGRRVPPARAPSAPTCARLSARPRDADARARPTPDTPTPEVQLLSNGRYHVMVTNAGGGYSRWKDLAVTRWREDSTATTGARFCYLRDVGERRVLVDRAPADAQARATATRRSSPRRAPSSAAATTTSRRTPRSWSRPRTTSSCAALRITNRVAHARARSRSPATPRWCSRRPRPTRCIRPSATCSCRPRSCRERAGDPVHAPAALGRRAARRGCSTDGGARRRRRRRLVRDRPRALHRPRPHASPRRAR